ncbi:MAG: hypothetical protein Kow0010_10450 [Dehalococcoidia bacterium]
MDWTPSTGNPLAKSPARRSFIRRLREGDAGQALVEFALILPLMLLLLFALADFGRAFYTWLVVTNAAREGARVGATQAGTNAIEQRIYDALGALDPADLTISLTNVQGPRGEPIEVDLTYSFQYVTPIGDLITMISGGSLDTPIIRGHASMRLE